MNTGENRPHRKSDDFELLVREIREGLRPGGPTVDFAAIHLYIAGDLNAEDARHVREHIVSWETWNHAYWEAMSLLEVAGSSGSDDADVASEEPEDKVSPERPTSTARRRSLLAGVVAVAASIVAIVAVVSWENRGSREVARIDDPFGRVTKTAGGAIRGLDTFPEEWREPIGDMLQTEAVHVPEALVQPLHVTLGNGPSMYVRPVSVAVKSDRPLFEWRSRGENVRYRVFIFAAVEPQLVMKSDVLFETKWEPKEPLKRGREYAWEVEVLQAGKTFASDEDRPRFRVLDAVTVAKVEDQERAAKGSHLVLSLIYLRAAMLDEAQRELEALKQEQGSAALVEKLLESLRKHR
jgi:hypothetical protein